MRKKQKEESGGIKQYMIVLILIFVLFSMLSNVVFFRAVDSISIESDLYLTLKSNSALKADIFPPTLYIVELDLLVQRIVNESDADKQKALRLQAEETKKQYLSYYQYWKENLDDEELLLLLEESDHHVSTFFQLYDERFLPALRNGDKKAMQEVLNKEMKLAFEQHRSVIDRMSEIIEVKKARTEKDASLYADHARFLLFLAYLISVVAMAVIALLILRKVTAIEKGIVSSEHETKMANDRLESIVEGLKRFKHSYDNTLASIDGFALRNDMEGLRAFLDEIIAEKSKNETINYFKLSFIQNPAVTGLVISKMIYAEKMEVRFVLKVRSEVEALPMKQSHLCDMLGVLLDNAIEAATQSREKTVSLKLEESENTLLFSIRNSVDQAPDRARMFQKGWSTKGEGRGFGLFLVKEILSQYENAFLNTTVEEGALIQELVLVRDPRKEEKDVFVDVL